MCRKAPWRSTGQEAPPRSRWCSCVWPLCRSPAQLEDTVARPGGRWDELNVDPGPDRLHDWPKETGKKRPATVIQTTTWARLSESAMCLSTRAVFFFIFFFLIYIHLTCLSTFLLGGNSFLQRWRARALATDHWSSALYLVFSPLWSDLSLCPGTQALLQAAGQGHLRSLTSWF